MHSINKCITSVRMILNDCYTEFRCLISERSSKGREFVHTERWIPVDLQKWWRDGCCHTGWHSTWFTAGGTLAISNRFCNFLEEKLLTPMARAWPDAYSPSIAFHVSLRHRGSITSDSNPREPGFVCIGQWIYDGSSGQVS